MKVIGLIGGMSWESTLEYYRIINQAVRERLGGQHSAKILLYSVDFFDIEKCLHEGRWEEPTEILLGCGPEAGAGRGRLRSHLHQHHAQGGPTSERRSSASPWCISPRPPQKR